MFLCGVLQTILLVTCAALSTNNVHVATAQAQHVHRRIYNYLDDVLENNYDKRLRPNSSGAPVQVQLDAFIKSMQVEESIQHAATAVVSFTVYLRMHWSDSRLAFRDVVEEGRATELQPLAAPRYVEMSGEEHKMWIPDVFVNNAIGDGVTSLSEERLLRVAEDGSVLSSQFVTWRVYCSMEYAEYPFDQQTCDTQLESYSFTIYDMQLEWRGLSQPKVSNQLDDFNVTKVEYSTKDEALSSGNYRAMIMSFHLERLSRAEFFIDNYNLYTPSIAAVIISCLTFLIDHQKARDLRIAIGFLAILAMMFITSNVSIPAKYDHLVVTARHWLTMCFIFVFVPFIQLTLLLLISSTCCSHQKHPDIKEGPSAPVTNTSDMSHEGRSKIRRWIEACGCSWSRVTDLVCLVIYIAAFCITLDYMA